MRSGFWVEGQQSAGGFGCPLQVPGARGAVCSDHCFAVLLFCRLTSLCCFAMAGRIDGCRSWAAFLQTIRMILCQDWETAKGQTEELADVTLLRRVTKQMLRVVQTDRNCLRDLLVEKRKEQLQELFPWGVCQCPLESLLFGCFDTFSLTQSCGFVH